jgi:signal transduction histidine kinase
MGITKDKTQNFYIATREGGLVNYSADGKIISINYSALSKAGINCLAVDNENNLLFETLDNKLLKYNGTSFREIILAKSKPFVNNIVPQGKKIWFATSSGCYYMEADSSFKINGIDEIAVGVLPIAENTILAGTTGGLYIIDRNQRAKKASSPVLQAADINCLAVYNRFILIGTIGDGVYLWEPQTDKVYQCDVKVGLADNNVFSIFTDSKRNIWVGTGTGIQQIVFNEKDLTFSVKRFSKADGYENSENNLNTITEDNQGRIWIGTTKGAFIYGNSIVSKNYIKPFAVIQKVLSPGIENDSFASTNILPWYNFPALPELSYGNNNISFTVKGIFMKDPDAVLYSYQLVGYDTGFSLPTVQTFFNYQNLEPGRYVFRVKAIATAGMVSDNIAEYGFSVATPFHKTKGFLFLIMVSLILTGVLIQYFLNKSVLRKRRQLELLRQEEQEKIRQRTSEDFHDELGNKLSRISLLADILQKKVSPADIEKNNLIRQIRENVQALYTGTKDVIWSLSPGSDNFLEILQRIEQFGDDLFDDSSIHFSMNGSEYVDPDIKLPMDFSRNIIMIFKELLNNCLRHARATEVVVTVSGSGDRVFVLTVLDNGIGFDKNDIGQGNGLLNIKRRAERIGATIEINPGVITGMITKLTIKIPSKGG